MKTKTILLTLIVCFVISITNSVSLAGPIGSAFTYQGRLIDANYAADGLCDFKFKLYDANSDGNQIGNDVNKPDVNVVDGYFTIDELDLGSSVFNGNERWLQIGVRLSGDINDPCVLSPRQKITPTPYAMYAPPIPGGNVPQGGIIMWSGSIASIPSGWALCDGKNGTPDLRERFIVGAGGDNPDVNGPIDGYSPGTYDCNDQWKHKLTKEEMPAHSHTYTYTTYYTLADNVKRDSGEGYWRYTNSAGGTTSSEGGNLDGSTQLHENRPPYYALAYIMKL